MAWVATQFGRLFLCFRYGNRSGPTMLCREPLHVPSTRETKAEAKRIAAKLQLEIDAGAFDYASWFPRSARLRKLGLRPKELPTLRTFAEESWLPLKNLSVRRSTAGYYRDVYRSLLAKSDLINRPLGDLQLDDIDKWLLWIDGRRTPSGEKLSSRRKNMARDVLCQILSLARERFRIEDLSVGLKVFKQGEESEDGEADGVEDIHPFSPEETERIIEAAPDWRRALVTLYFFTGLRRGEGLGLTWNNLSLDESQLIVAQSVGRYGRTRPKTAASRRRVQFGPRVRDELLAQRRRVELASSYVFPNRSGEALNHRWVAQVMWRQILDRAGVNYRPIGQTRHTYAALMLQRGAPVAWLQRQMGHTTLQMLIRHYWRYMRTHDLEATDIARIERAASGADAVSSTLI